MGRTLLSFLLGLYGLFVASASKLVLPPISTRARDGAFASVQQLMPTVAPAYAELLRRKDYDMGHDTCGFGAIDTGLTYKCYDSIGTCENIGNYRGCCTGALKACSSTFWTQCDDYDSTSFCDDMSRTRCCQSALPYCITWLFSTSDSTVTAWDCDTQSKTREFELLATPLSLISSTSTAPTTTTTSTSASSLAMLENTSLLSATSDLVAASSSATNITSSADNEPISKSTSSTTPVGAIVGGAVGGVAIIALIVLGIFFLNRYQQHDSKTPSRPPTPPSPQELSTDESKYPEVMVQPVSIEAPYAPAIGTNHNRAELN